MSDGSDAVPVLLLTLNRFLIVLVLLSWYFEYVNTSLCRKVVHDGKVDRKILKNLCNNVNEIDLSLFF